jgi:hypothetical protein
MAQVTHPILGAIDPSVPGRWDADVNFGGRVVTVHLAIEEPELPPSALAELPQSLLDLEPFDRAARAAILSDAQSGDDDAASVLYLTHHHEVLSHEDYQRLFGVIAPDLANPQPLLSRLALVRVGLYPEQDDRRILLDYSIDPGTTNYLLCVSFDSDGQPIAVDLES